MYPEYIMRKVRQALGYEPNDKKMDEYINTLSKYEVFELYLQWEGIIGYTDQIQSAVFGIYGIELNRM